MVPFRIRFIWFLKFRQGLISIYSKRGLLLKDGKDNNKAEILFATDDEIVLNKAQIADQRTLFSKQPLVR
jgi:hypothetical protein